MNILSLYINCSNLVSLQDQYQQHTLILSMLD